jgi:transcriptional regulator with PAS, ATPase and Fis domain
MANKGSILLDEIGEIPIQLQAKLLRVLQEREIQRIGDSKKIKIDVRILASTNRDLMKLMKEKMFREDLYYRLNVLPIHVPPLRERIDDLELLVNNFLHEYNAKYNKNKILSHESYDEIKKYKWPGNVRQLKNTIKQMVILVDDDIIKKHHIKELINNTSDNENNIFNIERYKLKEAKEIIEKFYIKETLKRYKNTRKAANHLGISQPSVVRKKKKYNI